MPLIDPQPNIPREKVAFKLEQATMARVRLYAEWIHSTHEWVVDRALTYFFAHDREFQRMLAAREAADPAHANEASARREEGA